MLFVVFFFFYQKITRNIVFDDNRTRLFHEIFFHEFLGYEHDWFSRKHKPVRPVAAVFFIRFSHLVDLRDKMVSFIRFDPDRFQWFRADGVRNDRCVRSSCDTTVDRFGVWVLFWFAIILFFPQTKVKCSDLRLKDKDSLLKQLEELKQELANLRVSKVTGGTASKLSRM